MDFIITYTAGAFTAMGLMFLGAAYIDRRSYPREARRAVKIGAPLTALGVLLIIVTII